MNLKKNAHIHLMGICGTAMASLAGLLKNMGYKISGSDQNVYPPMSTQLEELGIKIMEGYKKENLNTKPDLVIVGNVITNKHEEAIALLESDIPYTSLPKALGDFIIQDRQSLVVTGTHGKTTTTSLLSWIAESCDKKPGFLVGGVPNNFSKSFQEPQGNLFIIEGDEYDTAFFDKVPKFLHYRPSHIIIGNIEFDHADIYQNLEQIKAGFSQLVDIIPKDGLIVACAEDKNVMEVIKSAKCKVITYGLNEGDYTVKNRTSHLGRNQFSVIHNNNNIGDIACKLFGSHNTLNALAAFALAHELNWDTSLILQGLASFTGVQRRQQLLGEPNGITVIEDFAHHPTAVKLTLQSLKERFPNKKVFCIFEPRSATTRRNIFQQEYVDAFKFSDISLIAKPFDQSKIPQQERFSTTKLVESLNSEKKNSAIEFDNVNLIVNYIAQNAVSGDICIIMSNGGFDDIYTKLLDALK